MAYLTPENPSPAGYRTRVLFIPNDIEYIGLVSGTLIALTYAYNFELHGSATPEQVARLFDDMFAKYQTGVGMIGLIFPFTGSTIPDHLLTCDGASHDRVDYPLLYDTLDAAFVVDADHFVTPDLRGRTVIGSGHGAGLTNRSTGDNLGEETHILSEAEMPAHVHGESIAIPAIINGGLEAPASAATPSTGLTGSAGNGFSHNNMQPSLALNYVVWAR